MSLSAPWNIQQKTAEIFIYLFACLFFCCFAHDQNSRYQDVMKELPGTCPAHEPPSMVLVKETFNTSGMTTGLCKVEGRARGGQDCSPDFWGVLRTM